MSRRAIAAGNPSLAVGYLRVSTEDQALGPEAQRAQIERWADLHGLRIVSWHEDLGLSGGLPPEARPGLMAALAALREAGAGALLAAKRDRIARDVMVAGAVERLVAAAGARLVTADGMSGHEGPEGMLMRGMGDLLAAYERALIKARTRSALGVKKSRGERVGSVPYGYALDVDGIHLVEHPGEQRVIERIRELQAGGVSYRRIVRRLNEDNVPARGAGWHLTTVQRILRAHAR